MEREEWRGWGMLTLAIAIGTGTALAVRDLVKWVVTREDEED